MKGLAESGVDLLDRSFGKARSMNKVLAFTYLLVSQILSRVLGETSVTATSNGNMQDRLIQAGNTTNGALLLDAMTDQRQIQGAPEQATQQRLSQEPDLADSTTNSVLSYEEREQFEKLSDTDKSLYLYRPVADPNWHRLDALQQSLLHQVVRCGRSALDAKPCLGDSHAVRQNQQVRATDQVGVEQQCPNSQGLLSP